MRPAATKICAVFVSAAVTAALAGASPAAAAGDQPPLPEPLIVESVTASGSGCFAGWATWLPTADGLGFTVTFTDFVAMVGVGAGPTQSRQNCQLAVQVQVPSGYRYTLARADYLGYADFQGGASGQLHTTHYFQGGALTARAAHTFAGPAEGPWRAVDAHPVAAAIYSPCGERRNLMINIGLQVRTGTSNPMTTTSLLAMADPDGTGQATFRLGWARCP